MYDVVSNLKEELSILLLQISILDYKPKMEQSFILVDHFYWRVDILGFVFNKMNYVSEIQCGFQNHIYDLIAKNCFRKKAQS